MSSPKIPPMVMGEAEDRSPSAETIAAPAAANYDSPRVLGRISGREKYTENQGRFGFMAFAQTAGIAAWHSSMSLAAIAAEEAACESVRNIHFILLLCIIKTIVTARHVNVRLSLSLNTETPSARAQFARECEAIFNRAETDCGKWPSAKEAPEIALRISQGLDRHQHNTHGPMSQRAGCVPNSSSAFVFSR